MRLAGYRGSCRVGAVGVLPNRNRNRNRCRGWPGAGRRAGGGAQAAATEHGLAPTARGPPRPRLVLTTLRDTSIPPPSPTALTPARGGGVEERLHRAAQAVVAPEQPCIAALAPPGAPAVLHLPVRDGRRRHRRAPERDARRRRPVRDRHARQLALVHSGARRLQVAQAVLEHRDAAGRLAPVAGVAADGRAIGAAGLHRGGVGRSPRFPVAIPRRLTVGGVRAVGRLLRAEGGRRLEAVTDERVGVVDVVVGRRGGAVDDPAT
eukprot:5286442-Prymnesium_polylepis.1